MYKIYMLRCMDNSIYTGITTDLKRRLEEHKQGGEKGAKYTAVHGAEKFECAWECESRANASKLEYWIKKLSKAQKEELIQHKNIENLLKDKINSTEYSIVKNALL